MLISIFGRFWSARTENLMAVDFCRFEKKRLDKSRHCRAGNSVTPIVPPTQSSEMHLNDVFVVCKVSDAFPARLRLCKWSRKCKYLRAEVITPLCSWEKRRLLPTCATQILLTSISHVIPRGASTCTDTRCDSLWIISVEGGRYARRTDMEYIPLGQRHGNKAHIPGIWNPCLKIIFSYKIGYISESLWFAFCPCTSVPSALSPANVRFVFPLRAAIMTGSEKFRTFEIEPRRRPRSFPFFVELFYCQARIFSIFYEIHGPESSFGCLTRLSGRHLHPK